MSEQGKTKKKTRPRKPDCIKKCRGTRLKPDMGIMHYTRRDMLTIGNPRLAKGRTIVNDEGDIIQLSTLAPRFMKKLERLGQAKYGALLG